MGSGSWGHASARGRSVGTAIAAAVLVGAVLLGAGCGASEPTSAEAAAAETADTVCNLLRQANNGLTESFNATSTAITDADDPATAGDTLVEGFDELISISEEHAAAVDELDLPAVDERDELLAELAAGADESIEVLEDERAEAEALPPIEISDQGGAIGGAQVALERARSVLEPEIGAYDDEALREAFAADDDCTHVIQPF